MGVIKPMKAAAYKSSQESLNSPNLSIPATPPAEDFSYLTNLKNANPNIQHPDFLKERLEHFSRRNIGRKKARRLENARQLGSLVDFMDSAEYLAGYSFSTSKGFSILFTDENCMRIWQYFISQSEEEQDRILNSSFKPSKKAQKFSPDERYAFLDPALRNVFKKNRTIRDVVSAVERDVVFAFERDADTVFVSPRLPEDDALELEGVCQYHLLKSRCINADNDGCCHVHIINNQPSFSLPELTLTEFLEKLYLNVQKKKVLAIASK